MSSIDQDVRHPGTPLPPQTPPMGTRAATAAAMAAALLEYAADPLFIGPYRVIRELGRGGMGAVFLAARDDDAYHRQVAIKVLAASAHTKHLERRFRSERQILARLDHPNIARLYEGGTLRDGRPYLVMEHVDGVPIDVYCDREQLSVKQRIALVRQVCAAVHHAHQNLVLHLDIKPGNILVTAGGVPKLLDFGIAKLLTPDGLPRTVEPTLTGQRPLTPQYASPEQLRGLALTTASDVYSLGVVLYELLCGHPPYRLSGALLDDLALLAGDRDPPRPSAAVAAQPADRAPVGWQRPAQWRRQLVGDLDHIVLFTLRRDPERRYGSVEQLADDLQRHLDGLPVRARHGTLSYRAGKLLQRYAVAFVVTTLILVLTAAIAVTSRIQAGRLERERDRAQAERDKAERIANFMVSLFYQTTPDRRQLGTVTATELMRAGAAKLRHEPVGGPDVRAALQETLGRIYRNIGLYEESEPLLRASLETREAVFGPVHPEVASSLHHLSLQRRGVGDLADAEALVRRALDIRERTLGRDHITVAESLMVLAIILQQAGADEPVEPLYRRATTIAEAEAARTGNYADLAALRQARGELAWATGEHEVAQETYQHLVDNAAHYQLPAYPSVFLLLIELGRLHMQRDDDAQAEAALRRALAILDRTEGADGGNAAPALHLLAEILLRREDHAGAEALLERALALTAESRGHADPRVRSTMERLRRLYIAQNRTAEAEALDERFPGGSAAGIKCQ